MPRVSLHILDRQTPQPDEKIWASALSQLREVAMAARLLSTQDVNWDLERAAYNILADARPALRCRRAPRR